MMRRVNIHDHKDPVATKEDRFAAKEIHAPEAIFGLCEKGQPRGAHGVGLPGTIVHCQDPAHEVLINLDSERMGDLLGNALIAEGGVTRL